MSRLGCLLLVQAWMLGFVGCGTRQTGKATAGSPATTSKAQPTTAPKTTPPAKPKEPLKLTWQHDLAAALKTAKQQNRLVFVDFYATWCPPCRMMERQVFPQEKVIQALHKLVTAKIDVDKHPKDAQRYEIRALPTLMVLDASGRVISTNIGAIPPAQLIDFVNQAVTAPCRP